MMQSYSSRAPSRFVPRPDAEVKAGTDLLADHGPSGRTLGIGTLSLPGILAWRVGISFVLHEAVWSAAACRRFSRADLWPLFIRRRHRARARHFAQQALSIASSEWKYHYLMGLKRRPAIWLRHGTASTCGKYYDLLDISVEFADFYSLTLLIQRHAQEKEH